MKEYLTVSCESVSEQTIEKSRFITTIAPSDTAEKAKSVIERVSKQNPFATHNCYAYIVRENGVVKMKFGDDGEPQGTAGLPMLESLKQNGLENVVAVVTRYFGGIKLGAGGLIRAYSSSVSAGIKNADVVRAVLCDIIFVETDYDFYNTVLRVFSECGATVKNSEFGDRVRVSARVEKNKAETLKNKIIENSKGKIIPETTGEEYCFIK